MNKIFKVVWSKTKNSYVVVSEIAKRNGKGSSSLNKKLIAAFLAAGTVLSVSGSAWADTIIVNGDEDATASGAATIAIGNAANVEGKESIAIGNAANVENYNSIAIGNAANVAGYYSIVVGDTSDVQSTYAIAIGDKVEITERGVAAIAIGSESKANNNSAIAIGNKAEAITESGKESALAIGAAAKAKTDSSIAIGHAAKAIGVHALAIGTEAESSGEKAIAFGELTKASGQQAVAIGDNTNATMQGAVAIGVSSNATNTHTVAIGYNASAEGNESIKIGPASFYGGATGFGSIAIGGSSSAIGDYYSTATGFRSLALNNYATTYGSVSSASEGSVALGAFSYAGTKAGAVLAEVIPDVKQATAIGYYSMATGHRSTATGAYSRATGDYSTADGFYGQATGTKATAIGYYSKADKEGAIALGADSIADRAAGKFASTDSGTAVNGKNAYDPSASGQVHNENDTSPTWVSTAGAVAVGSAENKITRQITNVAAGSAETDAVNVAQLKQVATAVEDSKTHYYSVDDKDYASQQGNYDNDGADGLGALAAGVNAQAKGDNATAVGSGAFAGLTDTSMGLLENATAIGANSYSDGEGALAVGTGAYTKGRHAITIGDSSHDDGNNKYRGALGENAIAIGFQASAKGYDTIAIGGSTVTGLDGADVEEVTVLGSGAWGTANYATALGSRSQAVGTLSLAAGANSGANDNSVAVGPYSMAGTTQEHGIVSPIEGVTFTTAVGTSSKATGNYSTAVGGGANASGTQSTAVGVSSQAIGSNSVAIGTFANYYGNNSEGTTAIGYNSAVTVANGVALGRGSVANVDKDVYGYDPVTGAASKDTTKTWKSTMGAVSVGDSNNTRQITNVAAGYELTDAVNVAQLKQVVTAVEDSETHYYSVTDNNIHKSNYNNKGATGTDSMAAGIAAGTKGMLSTVTGSYSSIAAQTMLQGTGASAFGNFNNIGAADNAHDGIGNSVVGLGNATNNANGALIFGTGNQITNSIDTLEGYNDVARAYASYTLAQAAYNADPTNTTKEAAAKSAYDTLQSKMKEFAEKAPEKGGDVLAIGGANTADYATKSSMIGVKNTIKGTENSKAEFNSAIGYNNSIENGSNNSIIGTNRKISSKDGIIVIGSALEEELTTSEANAVVIGTNANVGVEDGVALGSGSVTSYKVSESSGYDVRTGDARTGGDSATATWLPTLGEVSVGGNGATRRITNVAAGSSPTDAVNVAQLATSRVEIKAGDNITVATSVAQDGHAIYTLSSSPETVVAQGTNVTVDGPTSSTTDGNGTTGGDNGAGNDATSGGTTESGTYTTNTYTVNAVDTKYTAKQETEDGTTTFTVSEVDGEDVGAAKLIAGDNVKITKGEDGSAIISAQAGGGIAEISFNGDNKDAQIDSPKVLNIEGGATGELSDGNIGVESDGKDTLTVKLAKDIKGVDTITVNKTINVGDKTTIEGNKITVGDTVIEGDQITAKTVKAGDTTINNDGLTIKNGPSVTKDGIDGGGKKITNVAPGTADTDAVNVSQLKNASGDIYNTINRLDNSTRKGIAGAAALAALHPMDFNPDDKMQFSAGVGHYRGETAAAIGAFYRPDESVMFSIGGTFGNSDNMINAGITFGLDGTRNRITRSRTAMAHEIVELRDHIAKQDQQIAQLTNLVNKLVGPEQRLENPSMFPDVPENHWAYQYVEDLQKRGIIEGYPDGNFAGSRSMTRYEFAAMLDRALQKGVKLDADIAKEFEAELGRIYVERIAGQDNDRKKIERVRVNNSDSKYPEGKTRDVYGSKIVTTVSKTAEAK